MGVYLGTKEIGLINLGTKEETEVYYGLLQVYPSYTYELVSTKIVYSEGSELFASGKNEASVVGTINKKKGSKVIDTLQVAMDLEVTSSYVYVDTNTHLTMYAYDRGTVTGDTVTVVVKCSYLNLTDYVYVQVQENRAERKEETTNYVITSGPYPIFSCDGTKESVAVMGKRTYNYWDEYTSKHKGRVYYGATMVLPPEELYCYSSWVTINSDNTFTVARNDTTSDIRSATIYAYFEDFEDSIEISQYEKATSTYVYSIKNFGVSPASRDYDEYGTSYMATVSGITQRTQVQYKDREYITGSTVNYNDTTNPLVLSGADNSRFRLASYDGQTTGAYSVKWQYPSSTGYARAKVYAYAENTGDRQYDAVLGYQNGTIHFYQSQPTYTYKVEFDEDTHIFPASGGTYYMVVYGARYIGTRLVDRTELTSGISYSGSVTRVSRSGLRLTANNLGTTTYSNTTEGDITITWTAHSVSAKFHTGQEHNIAERRIEETTGYSITSLPQTKVSCDGILSYSPIVGNRSYQYYWVYTSNASGTTISSTQYGVAPDRITCSSTWVHISGTSFKVDANSGSSDRTATIYAYLDSKSDSGTIEQWKAATRQYVYTIKDFGVSPDTMNYNAYGTGNMATVSGITQRTEIITKDGETTTGSTVNYNDTTNPLILSGADNSRFRLASYDGQTTGAYSVKWQYPSSTGYARAKVYAYAENTGSRQYDAVLGYQDSSIHFYQKVRPPYVTISPTSITGIAASGTTGYITVTSNVTWVPDTPQTWLHLSKSSSTRLNYTADTTDVSTTRTGEINFNYDGDTLATCSVSQVGKTAAKISISTSYSGTYIDYTNSTYTMPGITTPVYIKIENFDGTPTIPSGTVGWALSYASGNIWVMVCTSASSGPSSVTMWAGNRFCIFKKP